MDADRSDLGSSRDGDVVGLKRMNRKKKRYHKAWRSTNWNFLAIQRIFTGSKPPQC